MGWEPMEVHLKTEIIRLWNRLIDMPESRLTKKVFNWEKAHSHPWIMDALSIFRETDMGYIFSNRLHCNVNTLKQIITF